MNFFERQGIVLSDWYKNHYYWYKCNPISGMLTSIYIGQNGTLLGKPDFKGKIVSIFFHGRMQQFAPIYEKIHDANNNYDLRSCANHVDNFLCKLDKLKSFL